MFAAVVSSLKFSLKVTCSFDRHFQHQSLMKYEEVHFETFKSEFHLPIKYFGTDFLKINTKINQQTDPTHYDLYSTDL